MDSFSSNRIEMIESKTELETVSSSDSHLCELAMKAETNQPMTIKRIDCPSFPNLSTDQRCSLSSSNKSMTPPKLSPIDDVIPTFPKFNLEPIGSKMIELDYTAKNVNTAEHQQCVINIENVSAKEIASPNKPQCRSRWDCDRSMSQIGPHQPIKRQKSMDDQYVPIKREKLSEEMHLKGNFSSIFMHFLSLRQKKIISLFLHDFLDNYWPSLTPHLFSFIFSRSESTLY